jgi:hypothetical protein
MKAHLVLLLALLVCGRSSAARRPIFSALGAIEGGLQDEVVDADLGSSGPAREGPDVFHIVIHGKVYIALRGTLDPKRLVAVENQALVKIRN